MRHRQKSERFSRSEGPRRALKKSLLRAILIEEKIKTSHTMAKALTSWVAKLITLAKVDTLHNRRTAYMQLNDHALVKRLFVEVAPRFKDVPGGYTRMFDVGLRKGDGNLMSLIELTKLGEKSNPVADKDKKAKKETDDESESPVKSKKAVKKSAASGVKKLLDKAKGKAKKDK